MTPLDNMKSRNLILSLIIALLIVFDTISVLAYDKIDFGPSLSIWDSQKREIDTNKPILNKVEIAFKLTLTNSLSYWMCWEQLAYNLKIAKSGASENYNIQQSSQIKECLPPNTQKEIWVLFDNYKKIEEELRTGNWEIKPEIRLWNINCYNSNDLTEISCPYEASSFGNTKEFKVIKEEPTTHFPLYTLWVWLKKGYNALYSFLGFLLALFGVIFGFKKLLKKK